MLATLARIEGNGCDSNRDKPTTGLSINCLSRGSGDKMPSPRREPRVGRHHGNLRATAVAKERETRIDGVFAIRAGHKFDPANIAMHLSPLPGLQTYFDTGTHGSRRG